MFVLDNNFILDIVARRTPKSPEYAKILAHIICNLYQLTSSSKRSWAEAVSVEREERQ